MKKNKSLIEPFVRDIWLVRDNGILEVKKWFIYSFYFFGSSADKLINFLTSEHTRYQEPQIPLSNARLIEVADSYSDLSTKNTDLPPRLISFSTEELNKLKTELTYNSSGFLLGDSIGGIAPNKENTHNSYLESEIYSNEKVLFNPGVLARIIIQMGKDEHYIFQLAQKNLKNKGQIFYKPIGGHLKFNPDSLDTICEKFKLELIRRNEKQDSEDVSLYIPSPNYLPFMNLFNNDILELKDFDYFENPYDSIKRELSEEIGPIFSTDGISLLSNCDLDF